MITETLKKAVIYQIYLRTFTSEGTLSAAEKLLPHLSELGIDIVYMSACNTEDDAVEHQSARQLKSGMNNTKNPYRIIDYFNIDEEYGTMDDLRSFVATAHKLNMKVLIDLVYLHCGINAVFADEHPDFIERDENGDIMIGNGWPFARLNFESEGLREYLFSNMEFYIGDVNADGFRCDVADMIPLDFWEESLRRIRKINPEAIMLNEGSKPEYLSVFDANYHMPTVHGISNLFIDNEVGDAFAKTRRREVMTVPKLKALFDSIYSEIPNDKFILLNSENHDQVTDLVPYRPEVFLGSAAAEAIMVALFTMKGIPMIYNGCEVADKLPKSMFWNRFCSGSCVVEWQNALLPEGKERLAFVKEMISLHRDDPAITDGDLCWYDCGNGDDVLAYVRRLGGRELTVAINIGKQPQTIKLPDKYDNVLLSRHATVNGGSAELDSYGCVIVESVG